jgi:hypothetical protein
LVQVYRPLPPGGKPAAVNKYHHRHHHHYRRRYHQHHRRRRHHHHHHHHQNDKITALHRSKHNLPMTGMFSHHKSKWFIQTSTVTQPEKKFIWTQCFICPLTLF